MAVQERVGMPLDDYIEQSNETPFEIINGERIPRLPTVTDHNEIIYKLLMMLGLFTEAHALGIVRAEATYVLPERYNSNWVSGSRIPDLMYISMERLTIYKEAHPNWRETPYLIVPDLVIEVISPTDKFTDVNNKVDAYLADGVRMIVLVDPQNRKAFVHTPDSEQPLYLSGDAQISLDEVIPELRIEMAKLFE